jgi:hypothetical protein
MHGDHFGADHSTGDGAYVRATFDGREASNCEVVDSALICNTPAGLSSTAVAVTVLIDGAASNYMDAAFTYLDRPTIQLISPPSGYSEEPSPIVITGTNFGPLSATGQGPAVYVLIGDRICNETLVVAAGDGSEQITCTVPPGHGTDDVFVQVDGTNSTEDFIFTDYNDAGTFNFSSNVYYASEEFDSVVLVKVQRSKSPHPSPATIRVNVTEGTAEAGTLEDPQHFIAETRDIEFAENQFESSFYVNITASLRPQTHPRSGVADDRFVLLRFESATPLHGEAFLSKPAIIVIEYRCATMTAGCTFLWQKDSTEYIRQPTPIMKLPDFDDLL